MAENQIVLFQSSDGVVSLPVQLESESVWLTQAQMAQLFGKDRTVIGRHIRNAIEEGEINAKTMCAKFAHVGKDGDQLYHTDIYSLDVIISVGYRVHSLRGVEFRRWATSVLKEYVLRGYAINRKRLAQLGQTVEVMKRVLNSLDTEQVLDVVKSYSAALDLLDGYDHQTVGKPSTKARSVELTYAECRAFIDDMKFAGSSVLFGNEKDGSFKSALGAVYQSFGGRDLYSVRTGEGGKPPLSRHEEPRILRRQQTYRRRTFPLLPQAQQVASAQGRNQAHRRSHACCPHRHDRRIKACREGDDGQSRDEFLGMSGGVKCSV